MVLYMEEEQNQPKKHGIYDRLVSPLLSKDFWIPRNFIDVLFILICFVLAWYAITYDIPQAKVPLICANYWNKWAAEKANYLGSGVLNVTDMIIKDLNLTQFNEINLTNITRV